MKYYKSDLLRKINSDNIIERNLAENQWDKNCQSYDNYFDLILCDFDSEVEIEFKKLIFKNNKFTLDKNNKKNNIYEAIKLIHVKKIYLFKISIYFLLFI